VFNSSLMCAYEPSLEKSGNSMDEFKVFGGGYMEVSRIANIAVSRPTITSYSASRLNVFSDKRSNAVPRGVCNNSSSYSAKSLCSLVFNRNDHYSFSFCSTPNRTTFPFASNIGLVNLNQPGEAISVLEHHGSAKLMKDAPGRLVTSDAENSLKSFCTAPVLLAHQPPRSSEPDRKGNSGILIYRSCLDRCLPLAGNTHEKSFFHWPEFLFPAIRTFKSFWPSERSQILGTVRFCAKFLLKFQYCSGVVFHLVTLPLVSTLVKWIAQKQY